MKAPGMRVFLGIAALLAACPQGYLDDGTAQGRQAPSSHRLTKEKIDRWMTELSNWGRWGKEDEIGAMNLITPAKKRQAAALVKEGLSASLSRNADKEKAIDNPEPFGHQMILTGLDNPEPWSIDSFRVLYHGFAHTHMDALCHMFYKGRMYNGFSKELVAKAGASKLGIRNLKSGIFTRGILMDIPRLKGIPYLDPGQPSIRKI